MRQVHTLRESVIADECRDEYAVGLPSFARRVRLLQDINEFILFSGVKIPKDHNSDLVINVAELTACHYQSKARQPTKDEWQSLDVALQRSFTLLSEPQLRRFLLTQFPRWVSVLGVGCVLMMLGLIATLTLAPDYARSEMQFIAFQAYALWLICLGALGSIAFVAMNLLSVQEDVTFDLTSGRMVMIRIIVGTAFALVLSFPFGLSQFIYKFADVLAGAQPIPQNQSTADALNQALFLLLPFVIGFSTSLVIFMMNRLVQAVHSFFGGSLTPRPTGGAPPKATLAPREGR